MKFTLATVVLSLAVATGRAETVPAKTEVTKEWSAFPTRTLADLPAEVTGRKDGAVTQYGGLRSRQVAATGFFYATNLAGRWWLVDPDGCLFLDKGVVAVTPTHGSAAQKNLKGKFLDEADWAAQTAQLLHAQGFNNLGAWSDTERMRQAPTKLAYTRILNLMGNYGQKRGGTYQQPGHLGYPNDCIFVFDPEFAAYCDEKAKALTELKKDPWLLGYFSDNELPFRREALKNFLKLPPQDAGHVAAVQWLQARHGAAGTAAITPQEEKEFLGFVAGQYFRIVATAIKKYDPNHLFLGSRINGKALTYPEVFQAAGPYVDVIAVNYYRAWTPDLKEMAQWTRVSGRPVVVTEWYAKAMDAGLANTGGAGWIVKTQRDRGLFYQNFTLGLLESKVCVGWDWFKYADNDPTDTAADPSNRDANKGLVNIRYEPYGPLVDAARPINERIYSLADYFDKN